MPKADLSLPDTGGRFELEAQIAGLEEQLVASTADAPPHDPTPETTVEKPARKTASTAKKS